MKEMLKFELRKLLRMKSLYVCAALLVLYLSANVLGFPVS